MTNEEKEKVLLLRRAGRSYNQIASETGIPVGTVKTFCRRNNVEVDTEGTVIPAKVSKCHFCGKPVTQVPGRKEKKFCSNTCRDKWWNAHLSEIKRDAMDECECPVCGKKFYAYPKRHRKYCSHACYIKGRFGGAE